MKSNALRIGLGLLCAMVLLFSGCQGSDEMPAIKASDFDKVVLQNKQPVLVDFSATWCGPCQQMAPIVAEVASAFQGKATVVKVDIDDAPGLAQKYKVSAIPCFIVFRNGQEVDRHVGMTSKQHLADMLRRFNKPATSGSSFPAGR